MIISLSQICTINDPDNEINGQIVLRVTCTKFLGVLIDKRLL